MAKRQAKVNETISRKGFSAKSRPETILYATLMVIAEGGVDSVTHRRIAAKAGVPLGSLTYHFKSREDIIRQAFNRYLQNAKETMREMVAMAGGLTRDNLSPLFVQLSATDLTLEYWRAEYELVVCAGRDRLLATELTAFNRECDAMLAEHLERFGVPKPMRAARALRGVVRGYELDRIESPDIPLEELEFRFDLALTSLYAIADEQTAATA